ncbi:MAG: hypothetical protein P8168_07025 [Deltaproteobacteria bacterium]
MLRRFWPRNTMKGAYLRWEVLEGRLTEARQRLARQYLTLRRQTEQRQITAHQGILRAARLLLDQPLPPVLQEAKGHLQKAFALQGQGFFRRVPSPLDVDLTHYAAGIENLCRSHRTLQARLQLAQEIIKIFDRNAEFSQAHFFRLALISPESAWLCFSLRQKRRRDRLALRDCLAKIGQGQINGATESPPGTETGLAADPPE